MYIFVVFAYMLPPKPLLSIFEIIFVIVIVYALGPLKLLHDTCIFIHKKLHFRKHLVKKIVMFSIICLVPLHIVCEPVYPASLALVVLLRRALDDSLQQKCNNMVCKKKKKFAPKAGKTAVWCAKAIQSQGSSATSQQKSKIPERGIILSLWVGQ